MLKWTYGTKPIFDVVREYYTAKQIQTMIMNMEISHFAFMQERTFKNAYVIADDAKCNTQSNECY